MIKNCLQCKEALGPGRPDRKFCDYQCRSIYHYEHTPDNDAIVRLVIRILKKNRKIMLELNPYGSATVCREILSDRGFDFNYHTTCVTEKLNKFYFCFEMGYRVVNDKMILLVRNSRYDRHNPDYNCKPLMLDQKFSFDIDLNVLEEFDNTDCENYDFDAR